MAKQIALRAPGQLPEYTLADAVAVKAWAAGNASEDQQKRAFEFVVYTLARIGAPSFFPGDPHNTAYFEGQRSIGIHLAHFVATPTEQLKPTAKSPTKPRGPDA